MKLVVLIAFTALLSAQVITAAVKYPVVIVPGLLGSQLEVKLNLQSVPVFGCDLVSDWKNLYADLRAILPLVVDCFVDIIRLTYNPTTHLTSSPPGVQTRVPGFGDTTTIENVSPMTPFRNPITEQFNVVVDTLVSLGYARNVSVRGAPYDWRKAPNELFKEGFHTNLRKLIEDTYTLNGNKPVVLVAHSMGGLNSLYLLQKMTQAWKCKYIHAFIPLGVPWGGAVDSIHATLRGKVGWYDFMAGVPLQKAFQTFPSTAFLFPTKKFFPATQTVVIGPNGKRYNTSNLQELITDSNMNPDFLSMYQDTRNLLKFNTSPGVPVHCIHGHSVNTNAKLDYTGKTFRDSSFNIVFGDGDGTVNLQSLEGCLSWQKNSLLYYNYVDLDQVAHTPTVQDSRIAQYIAAVATGLQLDVPNPACPVVG